MKTELLDKIEDLFFENSFGDVSMDDIAKRLNIKKASIYYYFPSKDDMFAKVLENSYEKYKSYLEILLSNKDTGVIIRGLIIYPIQNRNLFSVVSQKGYCKIGIIRDIISDKNKTLLTILHKYLLDNFNFSLEKSIILQGLLNDLSKKYCIFDCTELLDLDKITEEIKKTFF